jgi:hypothetical protein
MQGRSLTALAVVALIAATHRVLGHARAKVRFPARGGGAGASAAAPSR